MSLFARHARTVFTRVAQALRQWSTGDGTRPACQTSTRLGMQLLEARDCPTHY